uniref:Ovule protein n=1 Tax=Gongylonema pulchrum TaxID=637853 RepID=A0A183DDY3_9BILA
LLRASIREHPMAASFAWIIFGCSGRMHILLLYWIVVLEIGVCKMHRFLPPPKCQRITVEQCKDLPYNETRLEFF